MSVNVGPNVLKVESTASDELTFTATVPKNEWFGISFGGGMKNKNLIFF